jgi:hypothetical protein
MHKAKHPDIMLSGEEIVNPNMKYSINPEDGEEVSFTWVKNSTRAKERGLRRTILDYTPG